MNVSSPQQRASVSEILVPWGSCLADKFAHFPWYLDKGAMSFSPIRFLIPALIQLDVVVVQLLSRVWLSVTPWTVTLQAPLSYTISRSLLRFMCLESVMLSNHLILCRPLLLLNSSFPIIEGFSNEFAVPIRWPKSWSFSFSNSLSNEHPGLISFSNGWFDLLAVQRTLKNHLRYHNLKA